MKKEKKPKPRCTNCGDETRFPSHSDMEREKKGWCVPCWKTYQKTFVGNNPDGTGYWKDHKSIYHKDPYSGTINGPKSEKSED